MRGQVCVRVVPEPARNAMRVLVGCEESGAVRRAFRARGHDAYSCDLIPASDGETQYHLLGDIRDHLRGAWDILIAFPPCTFLCTSGARWCVGDTPQAAARRQSRKNALQLVRDILDAPIPMIGLENPIGAISSAIRQPDQIIQPFQFGHPAMKTTCLWLKNLPPLRPTNVVEPEYVTSGTGRRWSKWFWETSMVPYAQRGLVRSKTFQGIAEAMADQWGSYVPSQQELFG